MKATVLIVAGSAILHSAERFVAATDGVRLFVQEQGSGTPIIVIHGGPGFSLAYLAPDLQPLAARFRLVFYDQRGTGRSTVVSDPESLKVDAFIMDLDRIRESIHARRVALLGHSWGAGLAALYAKAHPDRVSRLLLVDAVPPRADPYFKLFQTALQSRLSEEDKTAIAAATARRRTARDDEVQDACRDYWRVFVKAYFGDPDAVAHMRGDVCAAPPAALRNSATVNRAVLASLGEFDWRPILTSVRAPTLVIHGDHDPIPMAAAREWAASMPESRLLVIENSGHFPFVEQPEVFFGASVEFLQGRWPSRAMRVATTREPQMGPGSALNR